MAGPLIYFAHECLSTQPLQMLYGQLRFLFGGGRGDGVGLNVLVVVPYKIIRKIGNLLNIFRTITVINKQKKLVYVLRFY